MNDVRTHPVHAASGRRMALPILIGIAVLALVFAALAASVSGFGARPDGPAMTNSGGTVGQGTNADTRGAGASASGNSSAGGSTSGQSSLGGGTSSSGGAGTSGNTSGNTGNSTGTMGGTGSTANTTGGGR